MLLGVRSPKGRIKQVVDTKFNEKVDEQWREAARLMRENFGLDAQPTVLAELPLKEQVKLYASSIVAIQQSGGASNTAIFLPKGATLILVATNTEKNDFMLW